MRITKKSTCKFTIEGWQFQNSACKKSQLVCIFLKYGGMIRLKGWWKVFRLAVFTLNAGGKRNNTWLFVFSLILFRIFANK